LGPFGSECGPVGVALMMLPLLGYKYKIMVLNVLLSVGVEHKRNFECSVDNSL
jgi:hypothetical protein